MIRAFQIGPRGAGLLLATIALVAPQNIVLADDAVSITSRKMAFSETGGNLAVSTSIAELFNEAAYNELDSGVASVIVVRFFVTKRGADEPTAASLAKIRVVYDLWDEEYIVQVEGPLGGSRLKTKQKSKALSAATTFDAFPIAPLSKIAIGPKFVLSVVVELNPVSPELLAEVRRWLTKPAGQERLDAGSSFFGSFVSVFVNPKLAEADRVVKYRSHPFFRIDRRKRSAN